MSTALYRKWRSQTFDEVVGQEHVTQTLKNALRDGRVAHAYLFAGPRGTGKTSTARILAKALNCTAPEAERPCNRCPTCQAITEGRMIDLIEIDAASNNSVDDIRELREKVGFRPSEGRYKIYIIDEVHMLSGSAFNALLKTLEEPPPHARFILATTEPHKIPATVISRCQRFDFRRIPASEIARHLQHIVEAEGFDAEPDALLMIARSAQGCMRDAVSLLDQMLSFGQDRVTLIQVQQVLGAVNTQTVGEFVAALAERNTAKGLQLIHRLVLDGASLSEFCQQVIEHLRGLMMLQMTNDPALLDDLPAETVQQMQVQAKQMDLTATLYAIKRFSAAINELKGGFQPQLPLELALIEVVQGEVRPATVSAAQEALTATAAAKEQTSSPKPPKQPKASDASATAPSPAETPQLPDQATAEMLRRRWSEFQRLVKQQCGAKVLGALNSAKDTAVGKSTFVFAFTEQYAMVRDMVDTPQTREQLGHILQQMTGRPFQVVFQIGERAVLPNAPTVSVDNKTADALDPLVEYAIQDLGAQVMQAGHESESQQRLSNSSSERLS
ncbi:MULTISPECIES: DNA polymerase III subunit gamma/tau [Caldilinea]|uniref:DNA polymerase III subunit gamma/tau n=1 Tax=Caldilinea aerophila (strain DSM 14535 / JCM 11387 / NBRC 104270 / STL-6-O1) TaxID=926550 RepID=I0I3J2_CALAS|nr:MULTISPECIES: DNA polymerase III subunit gamma/tau [Caldilinea]BAL99829.1 DNA polymerase III gamma and tau subunit [Caldilinea aerophila DSM 14535 = NBRC 104270]GIV73574.1 MAG: DNA polymerase III subunit gamma/tau [Caldilinea sp.]